MANKVLVMPKMTVKIVTGETCYPGEGGFAAIYAEAAPDETTLVAELSHAQEHGEIITLRCSAVDVTGKITKCRPEGGKSVFVLSIDDMSYQPGRPLSPTIRWS